MHKEKPALTLSWTKKKIFVTSEIRPSTLMSHHLRRSTNTLRRICKGTSTCVCVFNFKRTSTFATWWRKIRKKTRANLPHLPLRHLSWTVSQSFSLEINNLLCLQARWPLRLLWHPQVTRHLYNQLPRYQGRGLRRPQQLVMRRCPQLSHRRQRNRSLCRRQLQPLSLKIHRHMSLRLQHHQRP